MIKVSVIYPNQPGTKFDVEYYVGRHIPMVGSLLGPAGLRKAEVERGIGSGAPGEPAPFHAAAHLYFDSVEDFNRAFGPNAERILGDIPNYTDVNPLVQISELLIAS